MKIRIGFIVTGALFLLFLLFTMVVMKVDVQPIGPEQSTVGLATVNQYMFSKLGVNLIWYEITSWIGIAAILVALVFGVLGITQAVKRRSLFRVDSNIILLGVYYVIVFVVYLFFEFFIVNYRPIVLNEGLEASFPSSHTMLVLCIMVGAMVQFKRRISRLVIRIIVQTISVAMISVTIVGRLISGVHWFTDIIAGVFLGTALFMLYINSIIWIEHRQTLRLCVELESENLEEDKFYSTEEI